MSRDIDQEVLDTLSTLLSFDEDNFLSQEEVEENLRNCPNIESDTIGGKLYDHKNAICSNVKVNNFAEENDLEMKSENVTPQSDAEIQSDSLKESLPNELNEELKLVKLEFTCEAEDITEGHIAGDYYIEDACKKDSDISYGCLQMEISSIAEISDKQECISPTEMFGGTNVNLDTENCLDEECILNADEERKLSSIMSDHNYTSQEQTSNSEDLHKLLVNHILSQSNPSLSVEVVNDFVDKILESMSAFGADGQPPQDPSLENMSNTTQDYSQIENDETTFGVKSSSNQKLLTDELKALSVKDAEDLHEAHETIVELSGKENRTNTILAPDASIPETKLMHSEGNSVISSVEFNNSDISKCKSENNTNDDIEFKTMNISDAPSPAENCSEPLEHTTFDEAFDLNCNEKLTVINHLEALMSFAKALQDDCETFTSSTTTIESKLQKYVQEQFEHFKKIVICSTNLLYDDKSVQTETRLSKHKLRRLNKKNKKMLLNSSDTDSSYDTSSSDATIKSQPPHACSQAISCQSQSDTKTQMYMEIKNESVAAEYDDGVPLVDYTQSEIFDTETFSNGNFSPTRRKINKNDSLSDGAESELEDTWHRKRNRGDSCPDRSISQNESDKENSACKAVSSNNNCLDEGDKEIERLINLNGLAKRSNHGAAKTAEVNEKARTKTANVKNKSMVNTFTDDEEIHTDASISESEGEIITEKQYLERYNESVKKQLLSDSNSETSESDVSNGIEEILSDNEGSSSPLVERFLKKFNANESDEETEKYDKLNMNASLSPKTTDSKKCLTESNKTNTPENSDCEVLDDTASLSKQSKPKSLEKMLSVVEKRKKMSKLCDSISLSSESDTSDVEAVEEANSRIIKPMLRPDQLATETRKAQRDETDRIRRLEKKHKMLSKLLKERPDVQGDSSLILDYNEETKTFIKVHVDIVKHLKPHQRDGVKFMYDSCYGGVESLKKSAGSGCILAHCMGLGKTLQLIALLHTVVSHKELKTSKVLVLCPKSTVMNWADEIERWLGPLKPKYYTFNDTSDINDKIQILKDWSLSTANAAGILLIGYEAFRTLVFYHSYKNRSIAPSRLESIRSDVDKYLLNPGADLVVCDEGHIIKNSKSAISLAVSQIKTPKRIVLTGTPIQNNLKEYYSMVNFIKPLFLGTEKEFANLYANPIKNGQHKDSSKRDIKVMKQRSFVLHKKLSKFVQRKEAELLKTFLPQKYEYVLFIPMTTVQNNLYEFILAIISKKEENRGKGLITDYTCLRKIWTHPKVLEDAWKNATAQKLKKDPRKTQAVHSDDDQPDDVFDSQTGVISVTNDWWRSLLSDKDLETILPSNKLRTMFEIIRMCEEKGEKCLIFSAFVAVLNVVEFFLRKMNDKDPDTLNALKMSQNHQIKNTWVLGKDYYRLDGRTPKLIRHEMIEQFNSLVNKRARVFLISSRAGGQGINLTGANRVIILDTSWNPSNDQQNIFRIFRLGQKKNCYIYRLLAMGTMEEKVYSRSVTKQAMSFRVVDEQQIDRHYSMAELTELYSLTIPDYEKRPMPDCPQDTILASLLLNYPALVYKYHEHDSLLENKVEQELSEQEKADAWAAYERDQQLNSEIRELPNMDELQNNLSPPKFPPYLGSSLSAFNQMAALFNYGNYSPAALSPYLPYLSQLGNFTTSSQQYLEMRKRMAEGTFGYPDINASLAGAPFSSPFAQNPPKTMPTNPLLPDLSLHSNALHTNPLSALGDLSMYGLGASNSHLPHNVNTPPLPQRQHNSPTYAATPPSTANNMQTAFDQYQMLENSLTNLCNYRHDFSAPASALSKPKTPNPPINQFKNPLYSTTANVGYENNAISALNTPPTTKGMEPQLPNKHADKGATKLPSDNLMSPLNAVKRSDVSMSKINFAMSNSNTPRGSPLPQNASKRNFPSDVSISAATNLVEERLAQNAKTAKDTQHNSMPNFHAYKSNSSAPTGVGGVAGGAGSGVGPGGAGAAALYTNKNGIGKTAGDSISTNPDMQIIPTSSAPGSANATKQFNEISPSISLTAVSNSITSSTAKKSTSSQKHQLQTIPVNNKMMPGGRNSAVESTPASTTHPPSKLYDINKQPINRSISKSALISAKPKYTSAVSYPKATAASSSAMPPQNSYKQSAASVGAKFVPSAVAKSKNFVNKKLPNLTMEQVKANSGGRRTSSPITTVKSITTNSTIAAPTTALPAHHNDGRQAAITAEKRSAHNVAPHNSPNPQLQKASSNSSAITIQPSAMKTTAAPAGKNMLTYILETCINQKKFAIGAPTKSGGGTTVTKVQTQRKRKHPDPLSIEIGSNEPKRTK